MITRFARQPIRGLGVIGVLALVVVGMSSVAGYRFGFYTGFSKAERQAQAADVRQQRIVDFITKRNPSATIREFAGLPDRIVAVSTRHGIDYRLVMAMIDKESQFRPDAVGGAGEVGLMQILPSTGALIAKRLGEPFVQPVRARTQSGYSDLGTLGDAFTNIRYGVQYLAWQVEEFGGVGPTALRAYNRAPQHARTVRPHDRYAEDISMQYVMLAARLPQ
jgi:soluble lytic murein transglycosylase-like protein